MNLLDRLFTLDFETTGVDTKTCKPVEVALYCQNASYLSLINPECPIPVEASAVHQISDADVANAMSWSHVKGELRQMLTATEGEQLPIIAAHNADYEKGVLGEFVPVLWVCTYKCALRIWPDAPGHKNEVLRYHLKLGALGRTASQMAHSAMHDAKVTYLLLLECLKHATIEQLIEWTELPAKLPRMPMGKHYGQAWDTVPGPYLQWCIAQADMREDVKFCAKEELARRRR